jgi:hypothetical protein
LLEGVFTHACLISKDRFGPAQRYLRHSLQRGELYRGKSKDGVDAMPLSSGAQKHPHQGDACNGECDRADQVYGDMAGEPKVLLTEQ